MDIQAPARTLRPSRESPSLTSVGFLLHLAQSQLRQRVVDAIEGSGLHPGQLGVLGALNDAGSMSQTRLCAITQFEKSTMVLFLDGLEAAGWVRRVKNPQDRRENVVELTPDGALKFRQLGPRLKAAEDALLAPLDTEARAMLVQLLTCIGQGPAPSE